MALPSLKVDPADPHFLATEDGSPFLLLADTAWFLAARLSREEARLYMKNRKAKGFNAFLMMVLTEADGLRTPTRYGETPFEDLDPARPREGYFKWIVELVDMAHDEGLYVGLIPAWGDKITAPWGEGPRIFRLDNLEAARGYGRYLAQLMANRSNVIWILGGDRPPCMEGLQNDFLQGLLSSAGDPPDVDWRPIHRAMAEGINEVTGGKTLMSYHPQGGRPSTSRHLHQEPWLHVNMMQSGHGGGRSQPVWEWIEEDWALEPIKPTLDGEPNYEDHPYNPWPAYDPDTGYFRALDVRKQCFRSQLAGGCGVVHGHHAVWQFWSARYPLINYPDRHWTDAIDRPGAFQVGMFHRLLTGLPLRGRRPAQEVFDGSPGEGEAHCRAMKGEGWTLIYFADSAVMPKLDLSQFPDSASLTWIHPETFAETPGSLAQRLSPPSAGDWLALVRG